MSLLNNIKDLKRETRIHSITPHILGSILENMYHRAMPKTTTITVGSGNRNIRIKAPQYVQIGWQRDEDILNTANNAQNEPTVLIGNRTTIVEIGVNTRDTQIGTKKHGVGNVGYVRTLIGKNADQITFGDGTDRAFVGWNCRIVNVGENSDDVSIHGKMIKLNTQVHTELPTEGKATRIIVQNEFGRVVHMAKADFKAWLNA